MATVIDMQQHGESIRKIAMIHALTLEINFPGMKASRISALAAAQRSGYTTKRTKRGALRDLVASMGSDYEPQPSVRRAMA